jgi:hypothetical protein
MPLRNSAAAISAYDTLEATCGRVLRGDQENEMTRMTLYSLLAFFTLENVWPQL